MDVMLKKGDNLYRENWNDSGADLKAKGYSRIVNKKIQESVWFEDDEDEVFVKPQETILIKTGVHLGIPQPSDQVEIGGRKYWKAIEGQVRPRSGMTLKESVLANLGTVDNMYRGDVGVIFTNNSPDNFRIKLNHRIGQLVLSECLIPVDGFNVVDKLDETRRGDSGFGDSGK